MSSKANILSYLQESLEELNAVSTRLDVRDFLVDASVRDTIPGHVKGLPEQLFISQNDDDLELALFIEPAIIAELESDDPRLSLHRGNLENFCIAAEGVSHFIFLVYRAELGRPVTHLEMELQAEVDKFVRGWTLLIEQGAGMHGASTALIRQLFQRFALREDLPPEECELYRDASRAAERFCLTLAQDFSARHQLAALHSRVRDFYRLGLSEKMRAA